MPAAGSRARAGSGIRRQGQTCVRHSDVGALRYFAIGHRPADGSAFRCATCTALMRSENPGLDADRAFEVFEQVLLQHPQEFWKGRVMTDEDFAQRHRKEEIAT